MFHLSGVRLYAKELESHQGWDPRFGVWEPQLHRVSDERSAPPPSLVERLRRSNSLPLPSIRVFWRGPGTVGDSLGNVNLESLEALHRLGYEGRFRFGLLSPWNVREELAKDPRVLRAQNCTASSFEEADLEVQVPGVSPALHSRCLRFLFHEFGYFYQFPIRPEDVLWAPSHWIESRLRQSFPQNKTICVPHGVNLSVFHPGAGPDSSSSPEGFRFLFIGTTISRKGIDLLLKAFFQEKENLPGAELVLKVFPTTSGFIWPEIYKQGDSVRVLDRPLAPSQMASLIRSCHVLVAPSRAEAFCLPVLEAMACGVPAIFPQGSAMQEFCPPEACFPVESELVQVPATGEALSFLEPDLRSLRKTLRQAYEERKSLVKRGEAAAKAAQEFSWEKVTRSVLASGWAALGSK